MKNLARNVLAVLLGLIVGAAINGGIISVSDGIIALPEGVDPNDVNSIKANIHLYSPIHFLFPFLAHALGSLSGGAVAALVAYSHKLRLALVIGVVFLFLGITMVQMVGGPLWFIVLDLGLAYIPAAWLGWRMVKF